MKIRGLRAFDMKETNQRFNGDDGTNREDQYETAVRWTLVSQQKNLEKQGFVSAKSHGRLVMKFEHIFAVKYEIWRYTRYESWFY